MDCWAMSRAERMPPLPSMWMDDSSSEEEMGDIESAERMSEMDSSFKTKREEDRFEKADGALLFM